MWIAWIKWQTWIWYSLSVPSKEQTRAIRSALNPGNNHLEMGPEYVQLNHSLCTACGFISMRQNESEALLMRATCLFACVCVVYKAENGPRVPRELQDSTSPTGAVNTHSVKEPAFVCSLNYRAHLSRGSHARWPHSCWEKQWNNDCNQLFPLASVLVPQTMKWSSITPALALIAQCANDSKLREVILNASVCLRLNSAEKQWVFFSMFRRWPLCCRIVERIWRAGSCFVCWCLSITVQAMCFNVAMTIQRLSFLNRILLTASPSIRESSTRSSPPCTRTCRSCTRA